MSRLSSLLASSVLLFTLALNLPPAEADVRPHAGMLRYPDVSRTHIVFAYANDLWLAPRDGGLAVPLASPPGGESFPRFSADGQTIAFVGNYDGNRDIYTIPVTGGVPFRVTHHPGTETICDWTPAGELLFFSAEYLELGRVTQLFTVPTTGGLPQKLPVPYGATGAIRPDGQWLAYTPYSRDGRTWKRYLGGMASDIWLFNLQSHKARRITNWAGTDSQPMWHGDVLYFMSDAGPAHRLNIWKYDLPTGQREQVTHFAEFDVAWPSIGPGPAGGGEIVFQCGPDLYLLDLKQQTSRKIEIIVPGDRPNLRPRRVDVSDQIEAGHVSPTGKRAVFEARGDIWTVPAKQGAPRNLTRTSGVAERDPLWSPDGKWIAYLSDATGEYELYLIQSDGKDEPQRLTQDGQVYRYMLEWSPNSKHILFADKTGALDLYTIETKKITRIDKDPRARQPDVSWSHDSNWVAYTRICPNRQSCIWLYNVTTDEKTQVTSGRFVDTSPAFDREGKYLFFASHRHFRDPIYEDVGNTFVYANMDVLVAVPLRAEVGSPWTPKSDEETWDTEDKKADDDEKAETKPATQSNEEKENASDESPEETPEPVKIELDGFELRALCIPVSPGGFHGLHVNHEGHLLYVRNSRRGGEEGPAIKIFDLKDEDKEEKTVIDGVGQFAMTADGKKLLVTRDDELAFIDAAADQSIKDTLPIADMVTVVNPREEWRQIFNEAWRIQRDFFYDPNMHGVNWKAVRDHYRPMLDDCVTRADVGQIIRELIAELNVGHAYYWGEETEEQPHVSVGLLGADLELHDGAYRIKHVHVGGPWDLDARGPLSQPGVNVKAGSYLLAVNGVPLDSHVDPWAAFQGLAGVVTTLTVSDKPVKDADARDVLIRPLSSEEDRELRYRSWVEQKRTYVSEKTDGCVGYVHVPDTGINGQNELFRQFYGQRDRDALIVDERWNGGGQLPHRFIELLNRPLTNYWALRDAVPWQSPDPAHYGPKCMLINGLAGSGGDMFPYLFRQAKLGKLIGMRTWGGLVGISGNPSLIDGAYVSVPTFAFYEKDGTWGIEGHGVDPDIEVIDDPSLMVNGGDPQLDAAIDLMLREIERNPYRPVPAPPYPDRSGMGINPRDR